jgi:hypothetical protein
MLTLSVFALRRFELRVCGNFCHLLNQRREAGGREKTSPQICAFVEKFLTGDYK